MQSHLPFESQHSNPGDFPRGSAAKSLPIIAGDSGGGGSTPESGRSPPDGNGNPLQHSCQQSPMDRGARWATVPGVRGESATTERLNPSSWHPGLSDSRAPERPHRHSRGGGPPVISSAGVGDFPTLTKATFKEAFDEVVLRTSPCTNRSLRIS